MKTKKYLERLLKSEVLILMRLYGLQKQQPLMSWSNSANWQKSFKSIMPIPYQKTV